MEICATGSRLIIHGDSTNQERIPVGQCPRGADLRSEKRSEGMPLRCHLSPAECVTDHLCHVLGGRAKDDGQAKDDECRQWSAHCPAHDDRKRSLSITRGTSQRVVWHCQAGCDPTEVKRAMIAKGISPDCIPWDPRKGHPKGSPALSERDVIAEMERTIAGLRQTIAEIEQAVTSDDAKHPQRMRLLIAMAIWECDRHEAARKLGISWRTAYRVLPK